MPANAGIQSNTKRILDSRMRGNDNVKTGAAAFARNMARFGSGDQAALEALKGTTPYLTGPLAVGSGIAGSISDIDRGTFPLDAIVGNIVRGGLVYGAGAGVGALSDGIGSIPAGMVANRYLPPAPQIGHAVVHGLLGPLPSVDAVYNPADPWSMNDSTQDVGPVRGSREVPDIVITKYALGPMLLGFAATLAIFAICWVTILRHPANTTALEYAWATDKAMVVVTLIYTPLAVWACGAVLAQVMYHGGRAVWIEGGHLRYRGYGKVSYASLPLRDVEDLSIVPGFFLRPMRIAIRGRNGVDLITPFFLSIPAGMIQARLKEAVASAKSS